MKYVLDFEGCFSNAGRKEMLFLSCQEFKVYQSCFHFSSRGKIHTVSYMEMGAWQDAGKDGVCPGRSWPHVALSGQSAQSCMEMGGTELLNPESRVPEATGKKSCSDEENKKSEGRKNSCQNDKVTALKVRQ